MANNKIVIYVDERGAKVPVILPENAIDEEAQKGIPLLPDICDLDWEKLAIKLNNLLVERGIVSRDDLRKKRKGFDNAVLITVGRAVFDEIVRHDTN